MTNCNNICNGYIKLKSQYNIEPDVEQNRWCGTKIFLKWVVFSIFATTINLLFKKNKPTHHHSYFDRKNNTISHKLFFWYAEINYKNDIYKFEISTKITIIPNYLSLPSLIFSGFIISFKTRYTDKNKGDQKYI